MSETIETRYLIKCKEGALYFATTASLEEARNVRNTHNHSYGNHGKVMIFKETITKVVEKVE